MEVWWDLGNELKMRDMEMDMEVEMAERNQEIVDH